MQHEAFITGDFDTHFVQKYFAPEVLQTGNKEEARIAAILMELLLGQKKVKISSVAGAETSNWLKNRSKL